MKFASIPPFSLRTHTSWLSAFMLLVAAVVSLPALAQENQGVQKAREASSELLIGNIDRAIQLYTRALNTQDLPSVRRANILNDRGVAYWRKKQIQNAMNDFNKSVALYPEYPAVYNNRGNLLLSINMPAEAIRDFNRAILLAPNYAAAYNNRANAYVKLNRPDDAEKDFAKAIKLAPNSPDAHNGRGRIQLAANRPYAALREFNKAAQASSDYAAVHRSRAEAHLRLDKQDQAIDDLTQAITSNPDQFDLYLTRGKIYAKTRNFNAALKDFTTVLSFKPDNVEAHEQRGLTYVRIETFDPALEDLDRAIELSPRNARAFAYRALAHAKLREPELSEKDMDIARRIAPTDAAVNTVLAEILEMTGDREAAVELHLAVLKAKPARARNVAALKRLTGEKSIGIVEVSEAGLDDWRVFKDGKGRYFATNDKYRNFRVPLEVYSDAPPRIIEWTLKKRPFRGIGVLRYFAGKKKSGATSDELEFAAIVDVWKKKLISLEPFREGDKATTFTWAAGALTVASLDGSKTSFPLRSAPRTVVRRQRRPVRRDSFGWSSDGQWQSARPRVRQRARRATRRSRPRRRQKKTLFDLFFNN